MKKILLLIIGVLALLALVVFVSGKKERQVRDAFLFGYPMIMTDETRSTSPYPANTFQHLRAFPDHTFRAVVRPNVDTLYSIVWLDLKDDALVLSVPDSSGRYYLMPMLDAWSNVFASPGSRTTGNHAQSFLIAGPGWQGTPPENMTVYRSPTSMGWMVGRIDTAGPKDFPAVHKFQDGLSMTPLKKWQAGNIETTSQAKARIPGDVKKAIKEMPAPVFFERLEGLMKANPATTEDQGFIDKKLQPLFSGKFDVKTLEGGKSKAYKRLGLIEKIAGRKKGWGGMTGDLPIGNYGTEYQIRAFIAHIGFGANEPVDAIYPNTTRDSDRKKLHSSQNYILRFEKDQLPPVNAYWSITVYDEEGFLIDAPDKRHAINMHHDLTYNEDGSLDVYLQTERPDAAQAKNWLPSPVNAPFAVTMRLYWPKEEALNGSWAAPKIISTTSH